VNQAAASQIAYTYDGAGTRVLSVGNGQNKLEFTALDGLLYYEQDLSTGASTNHLYLYRQKLVDVDSNGTTTFFHSDPIGSPVAATDAAGKLLWRSHYQPFGEKAFSAGAVTPIKNQQWFTGKPFDEATGLSYFGARWYDPVLGRFTAIDPVDWSEANPIHSFNRYAYANNNPFKFVDPDGRWAIQAYAFGVGFTLGAINAASKPGWTVGSVLREGTIGGVVGAASTLGGGVVVNTAITAVSAYAGEVTNQVLSGEKIDHTKAQNATAFAVIGLGAVKLGVKAHVPNSKYPQMRNPNQKADYLAGKTQRSSDLNPDTFTPAKRADAEIPAGIANATGTTLGQIGGEKLNSAPASNNP